MAKKQYKRKITHEKENDALMWATKGLNNNEIAAMIGVSKNCLYNYLRDFPEFAERLESAKQMTTIKARTNVHDSIAEGDLSTSKWYLERKAPDYSTKADIAVSQDISIEDREEALEELMQAFIVK